jgi:hypothetical protein
VVSLARQISQELVQQAAARESAAIEGRKNHGH